MSANQQDNNVRLTGGGRTAVFRQGDTVLRETGPWNDDALPLLGRLLRELHDDDIAARQRLSSANARARGVCAILDGYGLSRARRVGFVDKMIEFAVHDAAEQAIEAKVTAETKDPASLWGIAWRTRSAAWMLRHRALLQRAL